jgi:hypothetical protein
MKKLKKHYTCYAMCYCDCTPCNFEKLYIGNFSCSNCPNKVVIFVKLCPCILWDEPTTHAKMPMMPNNMLNVKHTNKVRCTSCICYLSLKFIPLQFLIFFSLNQRPFSRSIFALHACCSKYKHS